MLSYADPAIELVCRSVRPDSDAGDRDRVRSLASGDPNWERAIDFASVHGVSPLLSARLDAVEGVPEGARLDLAERARGTAVRNLEMARELHELWAAFESAGVRALPFKGPVLAEAAYGDLTRRTFGDLDVLVHPEDVTAAADALESLGFAWREDAPRLDDAALLGGPFTLPVVNEYHFRRGDVEVELRWRVGDSSRPFPVDFETLWDRRREVDVAGSRLPALSAADRLLVLAFHGTKHRWHLLKWVADFAWAADEATGVDRERLLRRAAEDGVHRKLLVGFAVADRLLDTGVPPSVQAAIGDDRRAASLADEAAESIAVGATSRPAVPDRLGYNVRASDSLADVLATVAFFAPLHPNFPDYRLLPLPGPLHPLYYLLRPLRLLGERGGRALPR